MDYPLREAAGILILSITREMQRIHVHHSICDIGQPVNTSHIGETALAETLRFCKSLRHLLRFQFTQQTQE